MKVSSVPHRNRGPNIYSASDYAMGNVGCRRKNVEEYRVIVYANRTLKRPETRYFTFKKCYPQLDCHIIYTEIILIFSLIIKLFISYLSAN